MNSTAAAATSSAGNSEIARRAGLVIPKLQPPLALPRRVKSRLQHPDLGILRPQHLPQPRVRSTQPGGVIRHGLIGHAPQAPTRGPPGK
jgi:hypothetical protein